MFVTNVWSLPATITVLSFALIEEIAAVDVISGEIESEVMVVEMYSYQYKYVKISSRLDKNCLISRSAEIDNGELHSSRRIKPPLVAQTLSIRSP